MKFISMRENKQSLAAYLDRVKARAQSLVQVGNQDRSKAGTVAEAAAVVKSDIAQELVAKDVLQKRPVSSAQMSGTLVSGCQRGNPSSLTSATGAVSVVGVDSTSVIYEPKIFERILMHHVPDKIDINPTRVVFGSGGALSMAPTGEEGEEGLRKVGSVTVNSVPLDSEQAQLVYLNDTILGGVFLGWGIKVKAYNTERGSSDLTILSSMGMEGERAEDAVSLSYSLDDINSSGGIVILQSRAVRNLKASRANTTVLPEESMAVIQPSVSLDESVRTFSPVSTELFNTGEAVPTLIINGDNSVLDVYPIIVTADIYNLIVALVNTGESAALAEELALRYALWG